MGKRGPKLGTIHQLREGICMKRLALVLLLLAGCSTGGYVSIPLKDGSEMVVHVGQIRGVKPSVYVEKYRYQVPTRVEVESDSRAGKDVYETTASAEEMERRIAAARGQK
jgi:hypothetical protein